MQNDIKLTTRNVIENKLLEAISDSDKVAIIATKQDLEDMIAALQGWEIGETKGNILSWEAHMKRRENLAVGLSELLSAAFK